MTVSAMEILGREIAEVVVDLAWRKRSASPHQPADRRTVPARNKRGPGCNAARRGKRLCFEFIILDEPRDEPLPLRLLHTRPSIRISRALALPQTGNTAKSSS